MSEMPDCAHGTLRMSEEGVFCHDCGARIDDEVSPLPADPTEHLRTVHDIDQAHASATQRIDALLDLLDKWQKQSINQAAMEATENPMVFFTLVQILRTRVDINEFPYMLAAAILQMAKDRVAR